MPKRRAKSRTLKVVLNGSSINHWSKWGLKQNPFPQTARYEEDRYVLHLGALDGEPIPDEKYIRSHLQGWSKEFIELCCKKFEPGRRIDFTVEWDE